MTSSDPDQVAAEKVADKVLKDLGMGVTWIEDKAWIRSRILDYITTALRQAREATEARVWKEAADHESKMCGCSENAADNEPCEYCCAKEFRRRATARREGGY